MENRVKTMLESTLPKPDLIDYENSVRQFAPEYAQNCYLHALENDNKAIGNYLAHNTTL